MFLLLGNKNFQIWNILQYHALYNNFYKGLKHIDYDIDL